MNTNDCQHLLLARSDVGKITVCPECRVVHVALQALTLRFDVEAFDSLARSFWHARQRLRGAVETARRDESDPGETGIRPASGRVH